MRCRLPALLATDLLQMSRRLRVFPLPDNCCSGCRDRVCCPDAGVDGVASRCDTIAEPEWVLGGPEELPSFVQIRMGIGS
jgi:hypothetical protein